MATGSIVLIAAAVAAAAATTAASYQQAKATKQQSRLLAEQAMEERRRRALELDRTRREQARLRGRQRARLAASGLALDEGTPLLIAEDSAAEAERKIFNIQRTSRLKEKRLLQESEIKRFEAKSTRQMGLLKGAVAGASVYATGGA